jgi:hypothetical protein
MRPTSEIESALVGAIEDEAHDYQQTNGTWAAVHVAVDELRLRDADIEHAKARLREALAADPLRKVSPDASLGVLVELVCGDLRGCRAQAERAARVHAVSQHVNYRETWRCPTCHHDHRVISATLTTLKPPAVGDRAWGPCQGACNATVAQPERHLELVAVETVQ